MVQKSRLIEEELRKRIDSSKVEIGTDLGPIDRITTLEGSSTMGKRTSGNGKTAKK